MVSEKVASGILSDGLLEQPETNNNVIKDINVNCFIVSIALSSTPIIP